MIIRRTTNDDQFSLLLFDGHGEYAWSEQKGTTCLTDTVFDVMDVAEAATDYLITVNTTDYVEDSQLAFEAGQRRAGRAFEALFPNTASLEGSWAHIDTARDYGRLLRVTGTQTQLEDAFTDLAGQLAAMPGGDDDVFDYWPSGMTLLEQMGSDLDDLIDVTAATTPHRDEVKRLWLEYAETFGDYADEKVPDWVTA
jgi:hypothetical protein